MSLEVQELFLLNFSDEFQVLVQKGRVVDCAISLLIADHEHKPMSDPIKSEGSGWVEKVSSSWSVFLERVSSRGSINVR